MMTKPEFLFLSAAILTVLAVLAAGAFDRGDKPPTTTRYMLAKILPLSLIFAAVFAGLFGVVLLSLKLL